MSRMHTSWEILADDDGVAREGGDVIDIGPRECVRNLMVDIAQPCDDLPEVREAASGQGLVLSASETLGGTEGSTTGAATTVGMVVPSVPRVITCRRQQDRQFSTDIHV